MVPISTKSDKYAVTLINEKYASDNSTTRMLPKTAPDFFGSRQYIKDSTAKQKTKKLIKNLIIKR